MEIEDAPGVIRSPLAFAELMGFLFEPKTSLY